MARWNTCNLLHLAPDAKKLWQLDAKGGGFVAAREQRIPYAEPVPYKFVAKSWASLWQPKLNVAWLPPEDVFLRVIELPASNAEETAAMVELQLEKLSPIPVTQIVWTLQAFPRRAEGEADNLQTVVVVMVPRQVVEEFLGKLEADGFQADRLEVPLLDQLAAVEAKEDGVWVFPQSVGGQNAALLGWWTGGAWRNLSIVTLPAAGEVVAELKQQIALIAWSGELEGWLAGPVRWHLVADAVTAGQWEGPLQAALGESVSLLPPAEPVDLAIRTAGRAAAAAPGGLLPAEFSVRYRQQFVDHLWLRGLFYAGLAYVACVLVYFCCTGVAAWQTGSLESRVAGMGASYTNALSLRARYDVLKEREDLKFAALDCWRLLADKLPPGLTLQRFNFADGQTLSLSGTVPSADITKIIDFEKTLRKATLDGRTMFNPVSKPADQLHWNEHGDADYWSFGLELLASAEDTK